MWEVGLLLFCAAWSADDGFYLFEGCGEAESVPLDDDDITFVYVRADRWSVLVGFHAEAAEDETAFTLVIGAHPADLVTVEQDVHAGAGCYFTEVYFEDLIDEAILKNFGVDGIQFELAECLVGGSD